MPTFFHVAPLLLAPGSVILPGNYGRVVRLIGPSHHAWEREQVLESVRAARYSEKPSRLACCFCFESPNTADFYRRVRAPNDVAYEVEKIEQDAPEHRSDFNVIQPLPGRSENMEQIADLYWTAGLWISVQEMPWIRCEEVLTASPLRIRGPMTT